MASTAVLDDVVDVRLVVDICADMTVSVDSRIFAMEGAMTHPTRNDYLYKCSLY